MRKSTGVQENSCKWFAISCNTINTARRCAELNEKVPRRWAWHLQTRTNCVGKTYGPTDTTTELDPIPLAA